jgi:hypothetical protein
MKKLKLLLLATVVVSGLLPTTLKAQETPDVVQFYKTREAQASPNLQKIWQQAGRSLPIKN